MIIVEKRVPFGSCETFITITSRAYGSDIQNLPSMQYSDL